jgi:hypothetical protein
MKTTIILLVLVAVLFVFLFLRKNNQVQAMGVQEKRNPVPRCRPVYVDPPTVYLDEPITYTEWDQEISSSL